MQVRGTARAVEVIERTKGLRRGELTITIGTGCCESTAPFLYEDHWPGPDQAPVGEVAGVTVYAPAYLRELYPGDDGVVLDVVDELAESLSIETELGCRLVLRGARSDSTGEPDACVATDGTGVAGASTGATTARAPVVGELPEALRRLTRRSLSA